MNGHACPLTGRNGTATVPSGPDRLDYYGLSLADDVVRQEGWVESTTEPDLHRRAWSLVERDDRIVVGGGGCGSVSALLAQLVGNDAVVTYEPNIAMIDMMQANIRVNGDPLDLQHAALWNTNGELPFFEQDITCASGLLPDDNAHRAGAVRTVAVDDAIRDHAATAVVLDVEGAEGPILEALTLDPVRWLVVEMHPPVNVTPILTRLARHYRAVHVDVTHGPYGYLLWAAAL